MHATDALLIAVLAFLGARTLGLLGLAILHRRRALPEGISRPSVSVIVPAHDEEPVIEATIRSLAACDWPGLEIVAVDDGSTDGTLARMRALEGRNPGLVVIALAENRGKAAALERGVAAARGDVLLTIDADTLLEPGAVRRLVAPFDDPRVGAVSGNVKALNRDGWLGTWQSLEYVSCLAIERRAQALLGCVTTVPGAAGAFRRDAIEAAGGFSADTLTEDTDLTLAILSAGWEIRYEDRAVARTEVPRSIRALFRQRLRWLQGNLQCAWKHRAALAKGPARLRFFGLPNFWFVHLGVYLLLPLSFVLLARAREIAGPLTVALVSLGFFAADLLAVALAYAMDRERRAELAHAPLMRLLWPLFLFVVFGGVLIRFVRGQSKWTRAPRVGHAAVS